MQKIVSLANIFLILTASFSVAPAFGQSADCACTTAYNASDQSTGQITAMDGQVLVSQSAGLTLAEPGAGLTPGSQVVLGPNSMADVVFGSCNLSVGQNSVLTVIDTGVDICLQIEGGDENPLSVNKLDALNAVVAGGISSTAAFALYSALFGEDDNNNLGGGAIPVSP